MRSTIITLALVICWTFLALALVPWVTLASNVLSNCQQSHSYETCMHTLK